MPDEPQLAERNAACGESLSQIRIRRNQAHAREVARRSAHQAQAQRIAVGDLIIIHVNGSGDYIPRKSRTVFSVPLIVLELVDNSFALVRRVSSRGNQLATWRTLEGAKKLTPRMAELCMAPAGNAAAEQERDASVMEDEKEAPQDPPRATEPTIVVGQYVAFKRDDQPNTLRIAKVMSPLDEFTGVVELWYHADVSKANTLMQNRLFTPIWAKAKAVKADEPLAWESKVALQRPGQDWKEWTDTERITEILFDSFAFNEQGKIPLPIAQALEQHRL